MSITPINNFNIDVCHTKNKVKIIINSHKINLTFNSREKLNDLVDFFEHFYIPKFFQLINYSFKITDKNFIFSVKLFKDNDLEMNFEINNIYNESINNFIKNYRKIQEIEKSHWFYYGVWIPNNIDFVPGCDEKNFADRDIIESKNITESNLTIEEYREKWSKKIDNFDIYIYDNGKSNPKNINFQNMLNSVFEKQFHSDDSWDKLSNEINNEVFNNYKEILCVFCKKPATDYEIPKLVCANDCKTFNCFSCDKECYIKDDILIGGHNPKCDKEIINTFVISKKELLLMKDTINLKEFMSLLEEESIQNESFDIKKLNKRKKLCIKSEIIFEDDIHHNKIYLDKEIFDKYDHIVGNIKIDLGSGYTKLENLIKNNQIKLIYKNIFALTNNSDEMFPEIGNTFIPLFKLNKLFIIHLNRPYLVKIKFDTYYLQDELINDIKNKVIVDKENRIIFDNDIKKY